MRDVVILKESMRQSTDPEYAAILRRLRNGQTTGNDMEMINGRVVGPHLKTEMERAHKNRQKGSVPLVVRGNELRVALNWECIGAISKRTGIKPVVVVASILSGANELLSKKMALLFETSDNQTNNLAVFLPAMVGMPVRITQNIAVQLGVSMERRVHC